MARKSGKNDGYSYRDTKSGKRECRAYRDVPGKGSTQLCARGKTDQEARNNLEKKYANMCKGNFKNLKSKDYTVESWFNHWLFTIMKPVFDEKKSDTVGWYTKLSNKFIPIIGKKKIKQLKVSDVQLVVNDMLNKGLSSKYIKEVCCLLSTCLSYAVTDKYMEENLDFSKVKRPPVKKKKKKIYGKSENEIISNYFNSKDFNIRYLPIKVMYNTGLRPEEIGRT